MCALLMAEFIFTILSKPHRLTIRASPGTSLREAQPLKIPLWQSCHVGSRTQGMGTDGDGFLFNVELHFFRSKNTHEVKENKEISIALFIYRNTNPP